MERSAVLMGLVARVNFKLNILSKKENILELLIPISKCALNRLVLIRMVSDKTKSEEDQG